MGARSGAVILCLLAAGAAAADVFVSEGTNIGVDVATDGRVAIDLLGRIWIVPPEGGEATAVAGGIQAASRPRWSPHDDALVYAASNTTRSELRILKRPLRNSLAVQNITESHSKWHTETLVTRSSISRKSSAQA